MITIGTGLGTVIFVDGKMVPNTELGHIEIRGKDAERRASDAARQRKEMSWEKWGSRFNEYLNTMEKLFWPDLFILGGGVSKVSEKFLPFLQLRTEVVPAQLLNQAGIVGAALYAEMRSQEK
jgi:polyphosphate glucokinase